MNKKYDLTVKVGQTKQGKAIWKNVGSVMENDKGMFIFLDKTFNPAGVPSESSSIIVNMFEPKAQQSNAQALGFDDDGDIF